VYKQRAREATTVVGWLNEYDFFRLFENSASRDRYHDRRIADSCEQQICRAPLYFY
jgi:hypothetical protein